MELVNIMKESNSYSPTEAATIIQRNLRKYLLRKQQQQRLNKLETLRNSETSKLVTLVCYLIIINILFFFTGTKMKLVKKRSMP